MDEINQVYETPKFDMKKLVLLVGSATILGFAMFLTFLLQSNKSNLSLQPSRAEQPMPTRKPTEVVPTNPAGIEAAKPIRTQQDMDEALKEVDRSSAVLNEVEKSISTLSPDSLGQ